jgi:2',3'-cyclic-nucleotide 2'-phosphodiesterase (5'-nucleotidase family)
MSIKQYLFVTVIGCYLLSFFIIIGCKNPTQERADTSSSTALRIHFTCDTSGRIEPCGCFTGQHGGLTRLQTWLKENDPGKTSLRVDVGGAIAGKADYDIIQYGYVTKAYGELGYHALNLGADEIAQKQVDLLRLASQSPVPLISASWVHASSRQEILRPFTIVQHGNLKVGILGVISPNSVISHDEGTEILSLNEAVDRHLPTLRAQSDVVVLLAFAKPEEMKKIAQQYFEIAIILGGDVSGPAQTIVRENDSIIAWTTNEARTVGEISANIKNQSVTEADYQNQLLWDYFNQDADIVKLMTEYRAEIRETKLKIDDPDYRIEGAIPGVAATSTYVGSETCQSCHPNTHGGWTGSFHARAFQTLQKRGTDADPHCIACHTVGFGKEGGYRRSMGDSRLTAVGCESCHGPGSEHVFKYRDGKLNNFTFRPLDAGDCTTCHHGEFSRPFDWNQFWPKVKHGKERIE